jgi:hypothetical protein
VKTCCQNEARKHVRKHRDTAVCEVCGRLLLGYTVAGDFEKTKAELARHGVVFEAAKIGNVLVIAKDRAPPGNGHGEADDADEDEDEDD